MRPSHHLIRVRRGEIAANVYLGGRPIRLFATQPAGTGLHFVSVPSNETLEKVYLPGGQLTHSDYPTLVPEDAPVATIGVGVTLARLTAVAVSLFVVS